MLKKGRKTKGDYLYTIQFYSAVSFVSVCIHTIHTGLYTYIVCFEKEKTVNAPKEEKYKLITRIHIENRRKNQSFKRSIIF